MAFQAGGTDYAGFQRSRDRAREATTAAQKAQGERERAARVKKSGERSGLSKLISAGVRGAAAYYTGGLSESMGGGAMIDQAMLGTDSEGRAVRNEYGDLVGAGASVYQAGKSMQDMKLAKQDAKFDKLASRRSDIANMLFESGDKKGGMKMLREIENMEGDYMGKRKGVEGANPFQYSDEDYSALQPQMMTRDQRAARRAELGQGGSSAVAPPTVLNPASTQPQQTQPQSQPQPHSPHSSGASMPPPASSVKGPNISEMVDRQAKSKKKRDEEKKEIKAMPGGGPNPYGDHMRKDRMDFSGALLSPEERKELALKGHFTGQTH